MQKYPNIMTILKLKILDIIHVDTYSVLFQAIQKHHNCPLLYKLHDISQLYILKQNLRKLVDVQIEAIVDKFIPTVLLVRFEIFVNQPESPTTNQTASRKRPCRPALTST